MALMQLCGKELKGTSETMGLTPAWNHNNSSRKHLKSLIARKLH